MKPYQLSGLSYLLWLYKNGASGILGDEMGLGKTLQTLSLFSYLTTNEPCPEGHQRPFLVVCPLSVLSSWIAECKRWTPHLRVLRFHGPTSERARLKRIAETGELFGNDDSAGEGRGYDVVVTSYEVFEREKTWFRRAFVWRYVVLDEGHKIKNDKTNIAIALQGLAAEYRLILTGTPLQNNLSELWALLKWLYPDCFTDNTSKLFSDAFDLTLGKNDLSVMDNARGLLELVMLRRMKGEPGRQPRPAQEDGADDILASHSDAEVLVQATVDEAR
jgi:SWI/SNF-related matrix-associated actin-dependent regulator of chromatin subfamily A member 5